MIFATFALGFFCPRHACEERDCSGRCSNETISLRCADTEVIRLVLLQTADDITGDDALAQLRKDAGGYGAGGTMLVTLRDSNAI